MTSGKLQRPSCKTQGKSNLQTPRGEGRLATVSDGTHTATYSYLADSDLLAETVFAAGAGAVLTTARTYEFGARLKVITNAMSGGVGGLLAIVDVPLADTHFCAYDGNGNGTALVDTSGQRRPAPSG